VLQQALPLFDYDTALSVAGAAQIERQVVAMQPRFEGADDGPPRKANKPNAKRNNQPNFHARAHLKRVVGVALTKGTGLSSSLVLLIISEIGTDMSTSLTVQHCASWLGLAPRNDISGGKVLRSRTLKKVNRATQAFRQAAQSVARRDSAFGAYCRRRRAQLGAEQATVATAHQMARVVYHLLKYHEPFEPTTAGEYDRQCRERELQYLARKAAKLGSTRTPNPPPAASAVT
jgi:transposase